MRFRVKEDGLVQHLATMLVYVFTCALGVSMALFVAWYMAQMLDVIVSTLWHMVRS